MELDFYKEVKEFDKKVLINHGNQDYLVPIDYSIRLEEIYKNAKLNIIKGSGHGFWGKQLTEVLKHIDEFLEEIIN